MDETEINVDLAEKYLLGELDEEARLDFEVEVFTNEESSEEFETIRHDLSGKYLARKLTGARRERFENYFLSSPYNMEVFLSERALFDAARELKKEGEQKVGFLAWLRELLTLKVAIPAFAVVLVAILGGIAIVLIRNGSFEPVASGYKPPKIDLSNANTEINNPPNNENNNTANDTNINGNTRNRDPNEVNKTDRDINKPTPQPSEGPVFAMVFFSNSSKSGEKEVVLQIGKITEGAVLGFSVPKENPGQDFTRYQATIENSANVEIWRKEFVNERRANLVKEYKETPSKFPAGNYVFRLIGISASGERETVTRTAFKVVRTQK